MSLHSPGIVAVIFKAKRTLADEDGYQNAANAMSALAKQQAGYCGEDHARAEDGLGITVSYWQDESHARAWHDHPDHAAIRDQGRDVWYEYYTLHVARIERSYDWQKADDG